MRVGGTQTDQWKERKSHFIDQTQIRRKRHNSHSAAVGVRSESSDCAGSFDTDSNNDFRLEANEERLYRRRRASLRSSGFPPT